MQQYSQAQEAKLVEPLTERELEIVSLLADGWTNRQIADDLVLAVDTVKWYNKRIYSKLLVKNRTTAVKRIKELGLLDPTPSINQTSSATIQTPHNLPAATTPFIGRELELNEVATLLGDETCRLVTILATGGMGKTRLALETAKSQLPNFPNGVYFIPLAQLRSVDTIISTIAASLNVQLATTDNPTTQLQNHLRDKTTLLVLDNFEHLLEGAGFVASLLEAAPHLKILTTSRERLNLYGEVGYTLEGMTLPVGETRAETLNCSAVQLFIRRMQMMLANSIISDDDLAYVRRICHQVGGMPLGIELASSLVDVLSLQEITVEIEQNMDILATEMRDVPSRLRSIRAIFDYSWSLLSDSERDGFMRLAIFRAGFTRDAAQVVAGTDFRVLKTFVNKSLVQRDVERKRYLIHEMLRQYAEEKLQTSGIAAATHVAHKAYYTNFMAQSEKRIKGHGQLEALNQIELDFENVRAAWLWTIEHDEFDAIDQSLESLFWFCNMRARVPTGEQLFQLAREKLGIFVNSEVHPVHRRLILRFDASGDIYKVQIEQMVSFARQQSDQSELPFFLWMLGYNRFMSSKFGQAIPILEEAVSLFKILGENFYRVDSLHWLMSCHRFLGQPTQARVYAKKIREISQKSGNKFAFARILGSQAIYEVLQDDNDQIRKDLHEAIAIRNKLGYEAGVAISLTGLGFDAFYQGEFSDAKAYLEDGLRRAENSVSTFPKATAMGILSWLAAINERYQTTWDLCQEIQSISSNPNVTMIAQVGLVMAACGLENYTVLRENVKLFLSTPNPLHSSKGLLSILPMVAILYASEGEETRAVEMLALAFTHPKSPTRWLEKWVLLERWQSKLQNSLGDEAYHLAWERGMKLEIEKIIDNF